MSNAGLPLEEGGQRWHLSSGLVYGPDDIPASLASLDALVSGLGIILPERYRDLAPLVQGLYPERSAFVVWDPPSGQFAKDGGDPDLGPGCIRNVGSFILLDATDEADRWGATMQAQLELIRRVGPGLLPIAFDLRGNLICLDYGDDWSDAVPTVAYYDRAREPGDDVLPVASDFQDFLESLMTEDDEDQPGHSQDVQG